MRVTYKTVRQWLESDAPTQCTANELLILGSRLDELLEQAQNREKLAAHIQQQADELARNNGFESYAAMQRVLNPGANVSMSSQDQELAPPRRPYLIPDDPQTEAYAVYKGRVPAEVQAFLDRSPNWTLEDMHYKRIRKARKSLGLPELEPYDPIEKHVELMAQAQRNPRRNQKK